MIGRTTTDDRLVTAYRGGDDAAFDELARRYRAQVQRYAASILGDRRALAEDVAQETLLRAALALRRDDRPIHVRAWLLTVARNCCLDELARTRASPVDVTVLADRLPSAQGTPEQRLDIKQDLAAVVSDIALLPSLQRHALVRREVDGISHAELARELGTTTQATRSLVMRARVALVRDREARDAACDEIRDDLLRATDERRRASMRTYRHLGGCADCRRFKSRIRTTRRALAALVPAPLLVALVGAKVAAVSTAGGKATLAKTAAVGCAGACLTAGAVELAPHTFGAGTPSPQRVDSVLLAGGRIARRQPLPRGVALVQRAVPAASGASSLAVTLACPDGLRVGDLLAPIGGRATMYYRPAPRIGVDRSARVVVDRPATLRTGLTARILCVRTPGPGGAQRRP
ncbi:RNA polymerase sigma factor [Baekduia alba]|uniref:sigma-70 family RNA polymerase sigma factor n=1 Tax=Baekduia alba TaxID=2997333 RepID=UPI00233FBE0F|nr:sigma-70 family RNA polymerase sigma factor [Baekduia alba]WCB95451.1 RNA polymerase sigma factor [Baekduia alba]